MLPREALRFCLALKCCNMLSFCLRTFACARLGCMLISWRAGVPPTCTFHCSALALVQDCTFVSFHVHWHRNVEGNMMPAETRHWRLRVEQRLQSANSCWGSLRMQSSSMKKAQSTRC